ncbi:MAG: hypothetical protein ACYC4S_19910 [Rhodoferax sp.]
MLTTVGFPALQFNTAKKQFVETRKVPQADGGFLEMPARYPTLTGDSICLERWHSWSLGFPQSSHPVGGGQTALLTLEWEKQLTAAQRLRS